MTSAERNIYEKCCIEDFGIGPDFLKYKMEDMETKLNALIDREDSIGPIIGAAIMKSEALISILDEEGLVTKKDVDKVVGILCRNNVLKING